MLKEVCDSLGIENTEENREEIKAMFKKHWRIDSLADLTAVELKVFMQRIHAFMATEYGIDLTMMGDPDENTEDTSLQEFLKLVYEYNKTRI